MGERRTNAGGYVEIFLDHEHILCRKDGWVLEHRALLFDAIGPEPQPCYWCGFVLPWRNHADWKQALVVDHLNERRTDNDIRNLVPACWYCNANRSWSRIAPRAWQRFITQVRSTHPNQRPNAIHWLAEQLNEAERSATTVATPAPPPIDITTGRAVLGSRARRRLTPDESLDRLKEAFPGAAVVREDGGAVATTPNECDRLLDLKVGDTVEHPTFGDGIVIDTSGSGDKSEAAISFKGHGTRHLNVYWAPLVRRTAS
jgi:hypothetical protein